MAEGNTCIAEPNLEVLPLKDHFFLSKKILDNDVRSNDTIRRILTFVIRRQQNNNAVNRNLTSVLNIWKNCSERF